jgi:hypothetical protein
MAAKSDSDHVVRLSLDFSDFVRKAKQAGEKSSEIIGKALEAGISSHATTGYRRSMKAYEILRECAEKRMEALTFAQDTKRAGKVAQKLGDVQREIAKLNQELNDQTLDESVKKQKAAERKLFQEKCKLLDQLNQGMAVGFDDAIRTLNEGMAKIGKQQRLASAAMIRTTDQMSRGAERTAEFMKMFRRDASRGADDLNDKLGGALETFRDGLSNIDVGSMLAGGGKGLGKGLGGIAEMLGGLGGSGGALGTLAASLGAVALVLGPLVIAFGVFAGVMFGIDKEVKEFNKSAINAFGTRGVMNIGMGNMRDNLTVLRHVTQDFTKTLGLSSDEAIGVFDALDAGGITMARLTRGTINATEKEKALGDTLLKTAATAKALGVSVSEFAGTLAEYTDSLAFSLENVTDQFALISKQAQDAGFSTRRFYSLITQATAGQASFNTHLDQTAALLIKMTKVLGEKQAAEVLGGAAGGFKEMGTQERYKTIMTTGAGRTKDIITRSAQRQASNFINDLAKTLSPDEVQKALEQASRAGVTVSKAARADPTGQLLVKELAAMSRSDQAVLTASFETSSDKSVQALGRQLDQLTTVSRGTTGGMAAMADAMSGLDPGATIAMKLQSAMAILGRPLNELTGIDRMAAESITGMSGAQIEQYQALARASEGSYQLLKSIQKEPLPGTPDSAERKAFQDDQDKRFGAHIDEQGKIVDASGIEVKNSVDLLTSSMERGNAEVKEVYDKNFALAEQAFDETATISEILQNKITMYLRGIYEDFGLPMIDMIGDLVARFAGGKTREERQGARDFRDALTKGIQESGTESTAAKRTIAKLARKETRTPEEEAQLRDARATRDAADATIAASEAALARLSAGDTSALTRREYGTAHGWFQTKEAAQASLTREERGTDIEERDVAVSGSMAAADVRGRARTGAARAARQQVWAAESAEAAARAGADRTAAWRADRARTGGVAPAPASVGTTARVVPGVTIPAAAPVAATAAPTSTPTAQARHTEAAAAQVAEPISAAVVGGAATTADEHAETRSTIKKVAKESDKNLTKILTKDMKLGNALARSNLPDAIAEAQVKQQIAALAFAAGLDPEKAADAVEQYMEKGTLTGPLSTALGNLDETAKRDLGGLAGGLGVLLGGGADSTGLARTAGARRFPEAAEAATGADTEEQVRDFIYRGDGVRGTITPIDTADDLVGMKGGGPLDRAMGGGSVTVNIYGGDERKVFDVVKRVLQQSGIGPGRVASRA